MASKKVYGIQGDGFFVAIGSKKATEDYATMNGDKVIEAPKDWYAHSSCSYSEDDMGLHCE